MLVVLVEEPAGRIVLATERMNATKFVLPERPPLKNASGFVAPPAQVAQAVANMSSTGRQMLTAAIVGGAAGAFAAWIGSSAQQMRPQAYPPMPPPIDAKAILASGMAKPVLGAGKTKRSSGKPAPKEARERLAAATTIGDAPWPSPRIDRRAILITDDLAKMTACEPNTETHWSLALAMLTTVWIDPYATMARMVADPAIFAVVSLHGRNLAEVREKSGDTEPVLAKLAEHLRRPS